ncbi:MAG: hypothetical protein K0Q95_2980 [Bacteroidota bacterium]|nr:hypothetical protein [Bacteroidota bacterium]
MMALRSVVNCTPENIQQTSVLHTSCELIGFMVQPFRILVFQVLNISNTNINQVISDGYPDSGDLH